MKKTRSPLNRAMFNSAIFDLSSASSNCCCAFLNLAKFKAAISSASSICFLYLFCEKKRKKTFEITNRINTKINRYLRSYFVLKLIYELAHTINIFPIFFSSKFHLFNLAIRLDGMLMNINGTKLSSSYVETKGERRTFTIMHKQPLKLQLWPSKRIQPK